MSDPKLIWPAVRQPGWFADPEIEIDSKQILPHFILMSESKGAARITFKWQLDQDFSASMDLTGFGGRHAHRTWSYADSVSKGALIKTASLMRTKRLKLGLIASGLDTDVVATKELHRRASNLIGTLGEASYNERTKD